MYYSTVKISHWLPIRTKCPITKKWELLYIDCYFINKAFVELFGVRKIIKQHSGTETFMENLAEKLMKELKCDRIDVKLMFGRHVVRLETTEDPYVI